MTEEEYFRKNYPDSCYGDKPLSPYWDFFHVGVELGERQSEKKIADLEAEVKEWKDKADLWCKIANLKDHNIMINKELEKENAELKKKLKPENCLKLLAKEGYIKFTSEQLTKAKFLLKQLVDAFPKSYSDVVKDTLDEARKFVEE